MRKVTAIIIGGGGRGTIYAKHILELRERGMDVNVVAIAEPRPYFRDRIGDLYHIPEDRRFEDWHQLLSLGRIADAAIITTQDRMHLEPCLALAELKYHILIEKPLAPDPEGCHQIAESANRNGVILSVCHVLRYSNYTRTLKRLIDDGAVGQVLSVQHLEPVGHWRFAHSYVRGNWRKESESSSVLLAKSIHDLDWISFIVNSECESVCSYGSLMFFRPENRPEGAADRCLECPIEKECAYSAPRFYVNRVKQNIRGAYVESVVANPTPERIREALKTSPYGRCGFACDNDVVDNQVVNMSFEDGSTASMTMTAFNFIGGRRTRIFGTLGEIETTDSTVITVKRFLDETTRTVDTDMLNDGGINSGHGGGDTGIMENFVQAVAENDPSLILTGIDETLESHLMVFAAEKSRREGIVCTL